MQTHPLGLGFPEALGDDRASSPREGEGVGSRGPGRGSALPLMTRFSTEGPQLNPNIPVGLNKDFLQVQPGQEYPALAQEKPRAQAVETGRVETVGKCGGGGSFRILLPLLLAFKWNQAPLAVTRETEVQAKALPSTRQVAQVPESQFPLWDENKIQ